VLVQQLWWVVIDKVGPPPPSFWLNHGGGWVRVRVSGSGLSGKARRRD
jgi:hypothetical protein